jgi:GNAT superfamily N-acetyltransferase
VIDAYLFRAAAEADIDAMRTVEHRAGQLFRTIGYDFCADGPNRELEEHRRVIKAGVTYVVTTPTAAIAGFAMFEPMDGDVHLVEIDVDPDHQKRGLARRMIAQGEVWSTAKGFDGLTLTTYRDVPWNAPFYRRLGFVDLEPDASRPGLLDVVRKEAAWGFALRPRITMRKRLK